MARNRSKRDTGRDPGGFVALPWSVLDCPAYARLSHPARALLFEFARQYVRDNNGRLLASTAYMEKRGWKSHEVITRAKRELLEAGFIFETVKGARPNKASWYAVTWYSLDKIDGYDPGAAAAFERGAYRKNVPIKNASLIPSCGIGKAQIVPPDGIGRRISIPPDGTIKAIFPESSIPPDGNHLESPSPDAVRSVAGER